MYQNFHCNILVLLHPNCFEYIGMDLVLVFKEATVRCRNRKLRARQSDRDQPAIEMDCSLSTTSFLLSHSSKSLWPFINVGTDFQLNSIYYSELNLSGTGNRNVSRKFRICVYVIDHDRDNYDISLKFLILDFSIVLLCSRTWKIGTAY